MSTTPPRENAPDLATPPASAEETRTNYDPATPPALCEFMLRDWAPDTAAPTPPIDNAGAYAARRRAVSAMYPGELLLVPTGHYKVRANDTHYPFRPCSDFFYLTGNVEPDCVLALVPDGATHRGVLFVEPSGRDDITFFSDRVKGEFWAGRRLGVERSRTRFCVDECRPLGELAAWLGETTRLHTKTRALRGYSPSIDLGVRSHDGDAQFAIALSEMRLIKDVVEIAELQKAIDATHRGFDDVIRALPAAASERHVEGVFHLRARVEGNDVGYNTIAASGAHACVLHWTQNDGALHPGDLMLLDAGVEATTLYTADITRTLPLSGRFSDAQRAIYTLVYKAQDAAIRAVRPGVDFLEPNRVAMRILAQGLHDLGVLRVPVEEASRDDRQLYRRYTLHNVSHMLGLDVHDCAKAREQNYKLGTLKPGIVLTVEPGLYFQADDLTVPPEFRGIGVRIEDDVLVTADGYRNLSAAIPRAPDDVEAWMARIQSTTA